MKKYMLLKLIGITVTTTIVLVGISILEVFLYSIFINPNQVSSVYDAHAEVSAPWISAIFGFMIFFLLVRFWAEKNTDILKKLAFLYPLTYAIWDFIIIISIANVDWSQFYIIFLLSQLAKFAGSYFGYFMSIRKV